MPRNASIRVSFLTALIAHLPLANAQDSVTAYPNTFNGPYYGVGFGATTFVTQTTTNIAYGSAAIYSENTVAKYAPMGTLFVGTSKVFNGGWYLGSDLGLSILSATKTNLSNVQTEQLIVTDTDSQSLFRSVVNYDNALYTNTKVSRNALEPFIDLKAGYLAAPKVLTYLSAGLSYNTIHINTTAQYKVLGQNTITYITPLPETHDHTYSSFTSSHKSHVIGLRAGAGLEYMLNDHLGLGAHYLYTFYPRARSSTLGTGSDIACDAFEGCTTGPSNIANANHAKVYDQEILLQLIYHLC